MASARNRVIKGNYMSYSVTYMDFNKNICLSFGSNIIPLNKTFVERYELITEENRKSATSAVLRAGAGAFLFGSAGLLAGVSAKNKGICLVAVYFKDGKQSLIEMDDKFYKCLIESMFSNGINTQEFTQTVKIEKSEHKKRLEMYAHYASAITTIIILIIMALIGFDFFVSSFASILLCITTYFVSFCILNRIIPRLDRKKKNYKIKLDKDKIKKGLTIGTILILIFFIIFSITSSFVQNKKSKQIAEFKEKMIDTSSIACNYNSIIAVKADGTVIAESKEKNGKYDYGQYDVENWSNISSISSSSYHTVGLKKDGTVIATGNNDKGQCNVSNWNNVKKVIAYNGGTVGLKNDGTVLIVGEDMNNIKWKRTKDIIDIAIDFYDGLVIIGLTSDGKIVSNSEKYTGKDIVCLYEDGFGIDINGHIIDLFSGYQSSRLDLSSDDIYEYYGGSYQYEDSDFQNIKYFMYSMKDNDATVMAINKNKDIITNSGVKYDIKRNPEKWKDTIYVYYNTSYSNGLRFVIKSNGEILNLGTNIKEIDFSNFTDLKIVEDNKNK